MKEWVILKIYNGGNQMDWYEINNKAEKAEIWIYEFIGKDYWTGEGLTAKDFQEDLSKIKSSQIDLHINSPGGDVFDGNTIYNLLKQHPANVTTYIDGLAASIASVIALAGDKVLMAENALFMVHQPWAFTVGNEEDHEKQIEILRQVGGSLAKTYMSKTNKTEDEIKEMMKSETWLSSDQAIEAGFADEISGQIDIAACAKFVPKMVKSGFKNIPETIRPKQTPNVKDAERALRDVGFSVKRSKTIVAKGFSDDLRDVDHSDDLPLVAPLRDVTDDNKTTKKKDRTADLLTRAEVVAPS